MQGQEGHWRVDSLSTLCTQSDNLKQEGNSDKNFSLLTIQVQGKECTGIIPWDYSNLTLDDCLKQV